MIINQKRLLTKRRIELKDDSFIYKENSFPNQFIEAELPYEELRINLTFKHSRVPLFWLGFTGLFGFFFFATLIPKIFIPETLADWEIIFGFGIGFFVFSFVSYINWINEVYITTTKGDLALFRTKSNSEEVDGFIRVLKSKAKNYVIQKYLDKLKGKQELQNERIDWMFEAGFISGKEFDEIKNRN
jgi:hypothetical protein